MKVGEEPFYLDDLQIESIVNRLVPLIAKPEDYGFFRAVIRLKAKAVTSGHFAYFVHQLLTENDSSWLR